jgi:hypothetical protein
MPFDGVNFEKKPDVRSISGLIAWLETQNPEGKYNWWRQDSCLIAHYADAVGADYYELHSYFFATTKVLDNVAYPEPWTFGEALARARKIKAALS